MIKFQRRYCCASREINMILSPLVFPVLGLVDSIWTVLPIMWRHIQLLLIGQRLGFYPRCRFHGPLSPWLPQHSISARPIDILHGWLSSTLVIIGLQFGTSCSDWSQCCRSTVSMFARGEIGTERYWEAHVSHSLTHCPTKNITAMLGTTEKTAAMSWNMSVSCFESSCIHDEEAGQRYTTPEVSKNSIVKWSVQRKEFILILKRNW